MATVGSHQQALFTIPVNGTSPVDAEEVRVNDNSVRGTHNAHDNDPLIHIQSSTLATRPAAGTVGRVWLVTDEKKLYYDTGTAWTAVTIDGASIDSGTIASARLTGAYTGITGLGTLTSLTVSGAATLGEIGRAHV